MKSIPKRKKFMHTLGAYVCILALLFLPACSPKVNSVTQEIPVSSSMRLAQSGEGMYSHTLELFPGFSLEFLIEDLESKYSFGESTEVQHRQSVITYYDGFLYYLSFDGTTFCLNRTELQSNETEAIFSTTKEKINSFVIINTNEYVFLFDREPDLGTPYFLTQAYYFNLSTGELSLFTEKYGLEDVPAGGVSSLTYYNNCYYFGLSKTGNEYSVFCQVDKKSREISIIGSSTDDYQLDAGNVYASSGVQTISILGPDTVDFVPLVAGRGNDNQLYGSNVFFSGKYMQVFTAEEAEAITAYKIDMVEQAIEETIHFAPMSNAYQEILHGAIFPDETGYLHVYTHPEDVYDWTWERFLTITHFDSEGSVDMVFPDIRPHAPVQTPFVVLDNTLYFLVVEGDANQNITSLALAEVKAE